MQIGHNLAVNQSYDTTFSTEMTNILFVTFAESNNALLNLYSSLIFIAILNIFRKQFGLGFTVISIYIAKLCLKISMYLMHRIIISKYYVYVVDMEYMLV